MKLEPFTVSVKAALPALAEAGFKLVIAGTGLELWIVKLLVFEMPPPGAGL